jgi:hypothetical protein
VVATEACSCTPRPIREAELEELALLVGPSNGILRRQVRGLVFLNQDLHLLGLLFVRQRRCPRDLLRRVKLHSVVVLLIADES